MEANSYNSSWRGKLEAWLCINSGLHACDAIVTNWVQFPITALDRLVGEQERKVAATFLLVRLFCECHDPSNILLKPPLQTWNQVLCLPPI
ncbi:hypothetical protein RchiOBHm_Chr4g0403751 [Rosa chinensis]|uniref:Uncharacterized protein n=1 Tax=Rosa chinensis TaxID=74649 RepID=A0A2P6QTS1_ROSCH|nr:hypothetical protein RchiOBHm_Chr4g0403751 [Rosa chinensis]